MTFQDTIFALSSGRLPSGVAIVRISGGKTRFAVETMTGSLPAERKAVLGELRSGDGLVLDTSLTLFFPGPRSFTGEDCAELHLHGGSAVVSAVLSALARLDGFRHAEAGEFTRRAFLNGKIDLLQAEALADLVAAETESQRRFALANTGERQASLYGDWRRRIIHARAMIEAELDFADEGDIPGSVAETIWRDVGEIGREIDDHVAGYHAAEIVRDGFQVVILGAPNAGKSSLLNALARREVAIVTDEPGTTRDLIEVSLDLHGNKIVLTDTAGIRDGAGRVETIGIERARAKASRADLVLLLAAADEPASEISLPPDVPVMRVRTKIDLASIGTADADVEVSSRDGTGLAELLERISAHADAAVADAGEILPSRSRHIELLRGCRAALALALAMDDADLELRAEELRRAGDQLGRISGAVDVEDLLDAVFSTFCVGK